MGLPETFSKAGANTTLPHQIRAGERAPKRALTYFEDYRAIGPTLTANTLGHQYLFGIFPVTRLFYQHSAMSLVVESTISVLSERHDEVYVTDAESLPALSALLQPGSIIRLTPPKIDLSVYDLFLARKVSLSGQTTLQSMFYSRNSEDSKLRTGTTSAVSFEAESYKSKGFAPSLSYTSETALKDSLRRTLGQMTSSRAHGLPNLPAEARKNTLEKLTAATPLIIPPPIILGSKQQLLGEELGKSYGFPSWTLDGAQVNRVIQRGLFSAARDLSIPSATINVAPTVSNQSQYWQLNSRITQITFPGDPDGKAAEDELSATFEFMLATDDRFENLPLFAETLTVVEKLDSRFDGKLVVALERASHKALSQFLVGAATAESRPIIMDVPRSGNL